MRTHFLLLVSAAFAAGFASCHSSPEGGKTDSGYTVNGTIKGIDSGWALLHYMKDSVAQVDSAKVSGGKFVFSGKTAYPNFASLTLDGGTHVSPANLFLEDTSISIQAVADSLADAVIVGGETEREYQGFLAGQKPYDDQWKELDKKVEEAGSESQAKADSLSKGYHTISVARRAYIKDYIKTHPASYVSGLETQIVYIYNPRYTEFDSTYQGLDQKVKDAPVGKELARMLARVKRTEIGEPAPEFSAADLDGKMVSLSEYEKGKVVLIDFWASWCVPCRAENPNVVKAYNAYKGKGFTVLGVSLDEKKEPWVAAVKADHLDWGQVSDLKGFKSDAAVLYGVQGIPMNYLVGKDGKIVAKGLRGEDLDKKLAELFK
ncbi:MAG: AhpC/TSA family protein [Bacteroidetes bacterium]|nr:AhpC/TSA family protein [Bacteroidota bacterium]